MPERLDDLLAHIEREARRAPLPIDEPIYRAAGRDPLVPILCAGSLAAPIVSIGRDLGRDEVAAGEPQIGAGGRLVRAGVYQIVTGHEPERADRRLAPALETVLLTNLVPYKPPGNKAYPESVRKRFRPFLLELLTGPWQGSHVLTLGTEAFRWFAPYLDPGVADAFWAREDRYEAELPCVLPGLDGREKTVVLGPLPHPSPLNQRWYGAFPGLLAARVAAWR
jgi:uracil-DNA glycosylase